MTVKTTKARPTAKTPRDARTGDFEVVKPAVGPKRVTMGQLRDAVRKVNRAEAAKAK